MYNTLLETTNIQGNIAERDCYHETKQVHSQLKRKLFLMLSQKLLPLLIKILDKKFGGPLFPTLNLLASINAIFNMKTPVKKKVLFEQAIIDRMSAPENLPESQACCAPLII